MSGFVPSPKDRFGSKAEELTASTTSLLRPWELTVQQMLRVGGSGHCTKSLRSSPLRGSKSREAGSQLKERR
jgi:hypothetical protein